MFLQLQMRNCDANTQIMPLVDNLNTSYLLSRGISIVIVMSLVAIRLCEQFPEAPAMRLCHLCYWKPWISGAWADACLVCRIRFEDFFEIIAPARFCVTLLQSFLVTLYVALYFWL